VGVLWPRVWTVSSSRQAATTVPSTRTPRIFTLLTSAPRVPLGGDRDLLQQVELVEHLAGAERHARERIFTRRHRQIRLLPQQVIEAAQQRAAAQIGRASCRGRRR